MKQIDEITIGADELILWLRKNGKALSSTTDKAHGLGFEISRVMKSLNAEQLNEEPCFWGETGSFIDQYQLPKTAMQYRITVDMLPELYRQLLDL